MCSKAWPRVAKASGSSSNIRDVGDHVFFYGTLMAPFNRPGRQRITPKLNYLGRGSIRAALFDLGISPAAIPVDDDSKVWGEVYETTDTVSVLSALDEIEDEAVLAEISDHAPDAAFPRPAPEGVDELEWLIQEAQRLKERAQRLEARYGGRNGIR